MDDPRIGTEVAGYRIASVLGQGGMGTVYVAEQSSPRRKVALKLLRPELIRDDAFRRRFEHESEAVAATEHPNIIPIYSAGEADGALYIAMRYVEGTDLRELIDTEGPLAPENAVGIVSQVASALDAAHRRGLVHRDVKPGNVLLDSNGNAYLCDFGLIKRSEVDSGLTKTGQFMGSIEYCAPEQVRGEEVDGRADVYSLGCVLYESLAGRPPFRRDTEVATLYAHLEEDAPPLPGSVDNARDLDRVLQRAMAKRPSDRFATAGELAQAARRASGLSSGEKNLPPRRSRRRLAAAVAGLVAVLAVAAVAVVVAVDADEAGGPDRPTPAGDVVMSMARLDPVTGELTALIPEIANPIIGFAGVDLAAGEGGVWVGNPPDVLHVDPLTETVRATIRVGGGYTVVAVGFRTVWVGAGDSLQRINPATDALLRPIELPGVEGGFFATWVATGEGSVWVLSDGILFQVDPIENRLARTIDPIPGNGVAAGDGSVWVIDNLAGELARIDPVSGRVAASASLPGSLDAVAVGGGHVWVLDQAAGTVAVVEPSTLSVIDTVRVGSDEHDMVFGGEAVWLADGGEDSVTRIDPLTRETAVFPVPEYAEAIAVDPDNGAVWVLIRAVS
jgi:YVTN family beta-propeller protein